MKTYTICGSMKFEKEMQEIAYYLETQKGYNILQCVYNVVNTDLAAEELNNLVSAHYKKIDMSDGIYVVNIDGYIGKSVSAEINYAKKTGKEILYHCE
ncbi:MAG: hypothetical protein HDR01_04715 [Lachnospiraceae bacterium]|nr:hypothetical protein [Lachnospiraceae bacterium]